MSKISFCIELVSFIFLVLLYFFIATRNQTKLAKIGEVLALYSTTFFFAFSKTISTLMFIVTAGAIILFNFKKARNERRNKRLID